MGRPSISSLGLQIAAPASRSRSASVAPSGNVKVYASLSGRRSATSMDRFAVETVAIFHSSRPGAGAPLALLAFPDFARSRL
jgi:hypothetical protein